MDKGSVQSIMTQAGNSQITFRNTEYETQKQLRLTSTRKY